MKAVKLTEKEKELYQALTTHPAGCLRQHIKPTGTVCYRLLDEKKNPLSNYRQGLVLQLADKGVLDHNKQTGDYTLKATIE